MRKLIMATIAAVAFVAAAPATYADPSVAVLVKQVQTALKNAHSMSFNIKIDQPGPGGQEMVQTGTVLLMKPDYMRAELWTIDPKTGQRTAGANPAWIVSDGSTFWSIQPDGTYSTGKPNTSSLESSPASPGFFDPTDLLPPQALDLLKDIGKKQFDGVACTVLSAAHNGATMTIYVGPDHFARRVALIGHGQTMAVTYSNLRSGVSLTKADFAFTKPAYAKQVQADADQPQPLLANGTQAPDFTVQDATGKPVKLSNYAGKVVVLDFWATWCVPCQMSLPHTNAVAQKYLNKNVVFLAINVSDTKEAFESWLPSHKALSALNFAIDPTPDGKDVASTLYKVTGIPTQYIIDPNGKIVKSIVGYDTSSALEDAVVAAGKVNAPAPATAAPPTPAN